MGNPYPYKYQGEELKDEQWLRFNTFALKEILFKQFLKNEVETEEGKFPKITLPIFHREPDEDELIAHLSSERVDRIKNVLAYVKSGPNHWLDGTIYALGGMESLNAFAPMLPFDEQEEVDKVNRILEESNVSKPVQNDVLQRYAVDEWIK